MCAYYEFNSNNFMKEEDVESFTAVSEKILGDFNVK